MRRIAVGIISFVMVLTCLFGVLSLLPSSYAASSVSSVSNGNNNNPKKSKPTYTDTLIQNNKLLSDLSKKDKKFVSFSKDYGKDIVSDAFSVIGFVQKSFDQDDPDWAKFSVDLTKTLVKYICEFALFKGCGEIVETLANALEDCLSNGESPLSEIEILSYNIEKQFNRISDQLYDIEGQISALSNDVQEAITDILNGTSAQIEVLNARQVLRAFMSQGEGNFSYSRFQNYLYGSTRDANDNKSRAYYNQLMEAIVFGADDETIRYYYNKLFEALNADIGIFREYYFGDVTGLDKSIAKYYYDYLSSNPSLIPSNETAESLAIQFAFDLYSTYIFSYNVLAQCYAYQIAEMFVEESQKGNELGVNSKYQYNSTDYSFYTVIVNDLSDIESYLEQAEESIVSDLAYILNMGNSYIVTDPNGDLHEIVRNGSTFGNIGEKQTVYINKVADSVNEAFGLNTDKYSYYINGVPVLDPKECGVITPDDVLDQFSVSVNYGNTELYSIDFCKESTDAFSGGSGSYDDPYLISNPYQFGKIQDEPNACYALVDDLQFSGFTLNPIGTYSKPFNGVLNGNGYTISNLTINSLPYDEKNIMLTPTTGVFGTLGVEGIVENLKLDGLKVVSDYRKDGIAPEKDSSEYFIGGLVGWNDGTIRNCSIANNSSITVYKEKQIDDNRCVSVFVGGIAGINYNAISYCSVDSLLIDAESLFQLHAQPAKANTNSLYVAGITATTMGTVSHCLVSGSVKLSAYAKTTANTEDNVKPYVTVKTGGIVAKEDDYSRLSFVYSAAVTIKCRGDVYNKGTYWGVHRFSYDHVTIKNGLYYPTFFWVSPGDSLDENESVFYKKEYSKYLNYAIQNYNQENKTNYRLPEDCPLSIQSTINAAAQKETKRYLASERDKADAAALEKLGDKIVSDQNSTSFAIVKDTPDVVITDSSVYEINASSLNCDTLTIKIDGVMAQDVMIINYYGFDTYNEEKNVVTNNVRVFFAARVEGEYVFLSGDVTLTIREDRIVGDPIISGIVTEFERNSDKEVGLSKLFDEGFTISYYHANGKIIDSYYIDSTNRTDVRIYDFDTSAFNDAGFTFTVLHNGVLIEQIAKVVCSHRSDDFLHVSDVPATCQTLGFEVWACNDCGKEIYKNYTVGEHRYVVANGTPATCIEPGRTQRVVCDVCGTVFEESQWIQALDHHYVSVEEAASLEINLDDSYASSYFHYCLNGDHYEPHQYVVTESTNASGKLTYMYTCRECGFSRYETDENLITDEQGRMPTVFVTDGYVLNSGDVVTVYVQLLNNPGFNGAKFGIRYSDGLELLGFEEGALITSFRDLGACCETYHGYNFVWATGMKNWTGDGFILKLLFRVVSEEREVQTVEIVYGDEIIVHSENDVETKEGGFSTTDAKYGIQKFLTHSGTIAFVEHLPGDVDGNGIVDSMDATYIAWRYVKKELPASIHYYEQYADVDLNGTRGDVNDIVSILQSLTGNFGTNLLNPEYKLFLNLNGYTNDDVDKEFTIKFYDDSGVRNTWDSQIDFARYEAEMNRVGYTFIGWYTRLIGGEKRVLSQNIEYDPNLGTQTLYAHWVKNSVRFEMNEATSEQIQSVESDKNTIIVLSMPKQEYTVNYVIDGNTNEYYRPQTILREFLYWEDQLGIKYYPNDEIRLFESNTLRAYLDAECFENENEAAMVLKAVWGNYSIELPDTDGRIGYKKIEDWFVDPYYQTKFDDVNLDWLVAEQFKLYGKSNYIKYSIYYSLNESGFYDNGALKIGNVQTDDVIGDKDHPDRPVQGKLPGCQTIGKKVSSINSDTFYALFGDNESITVVAEWTALPIKITIRGIDEKDYRNGQYGAQTITELYYCYGDRTHEQGYYGESGLSNRKPKFSYTHYTHFVIQGCYGAEITNNGHSSENGDQSVSLVASTAYFDASGSPTSKKPETSTTIYAYCCPNQYTITINNAKQGTSTQGSTVLKVYYNEAMPSSISMYQHPYYLCKYTYNGVVVYDTDGKLNETFGIASYVHDGFTLECNWETQKYPEYTYINDYEGLKAIAQNTGIKYMLISDIQCSGKWTPISTFEGTLDGKGNKIKGLYVSISMEGVMANTNEVHGGFICNNRGTIQNVTFESINVYYNGVKPRTVYVGGIVGANEGVISECQIIGGSIEGNTGSDGISANFVSMTGGICGNNFNTISHCTVQNVNVIAVANCLEGTARVYAGGITGKNNYQVLECSNYNSSITARGGGNNKCKVYNCAGGIVGNNSPGCSVKLDELGSVSLPSSLETILTNGKGKTVDGWGNAARGYVIGMQE